MINTEEKLKEYIKIEDKKLPQILKVLDGVNLEFAFRLLNSAKNKIEEISSKTIFDSTLLKEDE